MGLRPRAARAPLIMSETFIKIDSLQHLEILRQTYPTNRSKIRTIALHCFDVMLIFLINADNTYIKESNIHINIHIHISMTSTFQCEYCQCFTFKRWDKFKLKCTSRGGMYRAHYFFLKFLVLDFQ